jgi:YrbI family 3-deoxy-D-manno-octulosonate 8-phosphate phosphatase
VLTDCDGVLTDGGLYYSDAGEEFRRFSVRDGLGMERLRALAGIETVIVTREDSAMIARRGEKLRVDVLLGVREKLGRVRELVAGRGLTLAQCAYIGDDVNDLDLLRNVGLSACPADGEQAVRQEVDLVCDRGGGYGAFRELAERILAVHGSN